jgi:hypothetical protein
MRRKELTKTDFTINKNSQGWYFTWNNKWENSGVGFFKTKKEAKEECDNYIKLHNQGTSLAKIKIKSLDEVENV